MEAKEEMRKVLRHVSIDPDVDEFLEKEYPMKASTHINDVLREEMENTKKKR